MPTQPVKVIQAFKFALDPTREQEARLFSHAGGARVAFNWGIEKIAQALDARKAEEAATGTATTKIPDHFSLCTMWTQYKNVTPGMEWVAQNSAGMYQAALKDAFVAWKNFWDSRAGRRAGRKMGRPRFRSRRRSTPAFQLQGGGLAVADASHIRLPVIGAVRTFEKTKKLRRLIRRGEVACTTCNGGGVVAQESLPRGSTKRRAAPGYADAWRTRHKIKPGKDGARKAAAELWDSIADPVALVRLAAAGTPAALLAAHAVAARLFLLPCEDCKGTGRVQHTRIVRANITRTPAGRWFVSLTVETHREIRAHADGTPAPSRRQREGGPVGVDWGVRHLATLSTGKTLDNPRHLDKALARLRRAQQTLSRAAEGSKRRERARLRVAKLYGRVADLRRDGLEKWTSALVHNHSVIVAEGWDIHQALSQGDPRTPRKVRRNRNRSLADAGLGMARWMIEHKAAWYGARVVITGRHEPTGRTCSSCGQVRTKPVRTTEERFSCPSCGHVVDRRINTARVLARLAHRMDAPSGGESQNARRADVRPVLRRGRSALKREARTGPVGPGRTGTPDP